MSSWLQSVDAHIASALSSWNVYTTVLALLLGAVVAYPIIFSAEPDTHPLLLVRQSVPATIRNRGESALYRASETPHGYPLKSGLNVKDATAPRWASGKDGDLRDVWREVAKAGGVGSDGREIPSGLIMTVLGKEIVEHEIDDLSKEINILGKYFKDAGIKKLAIYLPNKIEYLLAIFACSFYGVSPVLLPYNLPPEKLYELVNLTGSDGLLSAAGSVPLADVAGQCSGLRLLTWVVESTSRHMDWSGVPDSASDRLKVSVWHALVDDQVSTASKDLPSNQDLFKPPDVTTIWQNTSPTGPSKVTTFTQGNLVAGIAGLATALPLRQRLTSADLVVPADSFANTYTLCYTFVAFLAHSSLAINSVAGAGVELAAATTAVKPTVVIASAETLAQLHTKEISGISSGFQKLGMATQAQTMDAGRMPTDGLLFRLLAPSASRNSPGQLRLLLTSDRASAGAPPLTGTMLSDLRIFTRARIAYALAHPSIAGAIAQSNVFDYRRESGSGCSPFGGPVGSVEIKVVSKQESDVAGTDQGVVGDLVVSGPSVVGETVNTGLRCRIRADGTIAYA